MRAVRVRGVKGFVGAAVLGAAVTWCPAGAAAQRPSVAILGVASEEGDDDLAAAVTAALREQLDEDPSVRVSSSRTSLSQMTMLQDCDIVEAECRMRVGKAVNADQVLYGGLRRAGTRGHEVEVHWFTTQDGKDAMARRALPAGETDEAQIAGHARALLAALRGEGQPEALSPVPDSEEGPPPVATVTPDVQPLEEPEADAGEPPPASATSSNDWLGYTLLGVAAVSAGLTVFSWTQIKAAESDDSFVAYGNAVYRSDPSVKDVCEKADVDMYYEGVDAQTLAGAKSSCDKGQTFDVLQYVFIGATLVSAGLGTYFLLDDDGEDGAASAGELSLRARLGRDFGLVSVQLDL